MEVFKPAEARLGPRRAALAPVGHPELEKPPDVLAYWRVIRKRRWTVITAFTILFGVVLIGTLKQKPLYRAKALLEIEKENPNLVTPQELFQLDEVSDAYLETEYKVLSSEDLAERVIAQLNLEQVGEFRPAKHSWPWRAKKVAEAGAIDSDPSVSENVLARFQSKLDVKPIRRSRTVEISFESEDPNLAARVVNTLASNYVDKNLEARWNATQKASEWLSQQMLDLKSKLEKSEDELQTYAAQNGLLFLETDKGNSENVVNQSLRELQDELTKAQAARYEKESLYRMVQTSDTGALSGVFDNKLLQDLSVRLAELQRERSDLATTFTDDYPKVKQIRSQIADIQSSLDRERQRAAQKISNDYIAAVRRESLVQQAFSEKQKQANAIAEKSVQYGILSREVESNKSVYEGLLQQLKQAGVSAGLKASNIQIVDPAKAPFQPVSPRVALNLGLGAILGMGLGVCAAFFQEHLDRTIEDAEDVERYLHAPALAFIPTFAALNGRGGRPVYKDRAASLSLTGVENSRAAGLTPIDSRGDMISKKDADFAEAFRALRTSVLFSSGGRSAHSILVTSAQPGEGKTTIATRLAVSLAQLGRRVLLVDADMRRPTIQRYFPQRGSHLTTYLAGEGTWQAMVYRTGVRGLYALLCGPLPVDPTELLSSGRMNVFLQEAANQYDFIILDSPPLMNVADARILVGVVDATILVIEGGETPRQVAQYAESQARAAGANLIGVVVNKTKSRAGGDPLYAYYTSGYRVLPES